MQSAAHPISSAVIELMVQYVYTPHLSLIFSKKFCNIEGKLTKCLNLPDYLMLSVRKVIVMLKVFHVYTYVEILVAKWLGHWPGD